MLTALVVLFGINILLTMVFVIALARTLYFDNLEECRIELTKMIKVQPVFEYLSEKEIRGALILLALFGKMAIIIVGVVAAMNVKRTKIDKGDEA